MDSRNHKLSDFHDFHVFFPIDTHTKPFPRVMKDSAVRGLNEKMRNIISFSYYRFTMDNLVWNIRNVSHFLHLKFHFGHKKWTSQKWCLEVHRTFFQEFRVKKRLSILKRMTNRQFLTKNDSFLVKNKEKFVEKSYLKTLISR